MLVEAVQCLTLHLTNHIVLYFFCKKDTLNPPISQWTAWLILVSTAAHTLITCVYSYLMGEILQLLTLFADFGVYTNSQLRHSPK